MRFFCIPSALFACKSGMVESLDYSQLRLEEVPKEILKARKHIEELLLNVNGIAELPTEFFRCTKLRKLDISENKIKVLPSEIGTLQSLMELNLSKNEFVEIPEEIGDCRSLMSLNLSTNIVPGLPKSIINLSCLANLNVSNNSLTQLPQDIDQLVSLQYLDAGQCELRFLPPSIVHLNRLKVLDLCENYLTELPQNMDGLASLEMLDLRNNMVGLLPEGILKCQSLRTLDLSSNNLTCLPNNLGDLTNLTELTLCDNQISILPNSIGQLKKLEVLKVSKNRISDLTPAICSCSLLTDLILCENQLNELPSSLGNLNHLKFLDLNVNNLQHLPTTIGGCTSLGVLSLRHNKLKELPMEIGKLDKLQVLDVIENNLTYLPFTLTLLYKDSTFSALWLSFNQPPLPKLTVTHEPAMNIKVLTCYLLPQKGVQPISQKLPLKSCVGGARVSFGGQQGSVVGEGQETGSSTNQPEQDENTSFGNFQRYDTPHPKPHAPKNRLSRNSGDFTSLVANEGGGLANGCMQSSSGEQKEVVEARPLRSVLKRRPQSVISTVSASVLGESQPTTGLKDTQQSKRIQVQKGQNGFGWHIVGGTDSIAYKGRVGVFISQLTEEGVAKQAGFHVDDQLVAVNGHQLLGATHFEAVEVIKQAGDQLDVLVERFASCCPSPANMSPPSPPLQQQRVEKSFLADPCKEIISVTLPCYSGSPGFSISGSGLANDPVIISALTAGGAAEKCSKVQLGDRLLSVNGVNVKNASHDQVVTLLTSHHTGDIYLVVERGQPPCKGLGTSSLSKSLPSLTAPPLPPKANQTHRRAQPLPSNRSMNSLLLQIEPTSLQPPRSAFTSVGDAHQVDNYKSLRMEQPLATSSPIPQLPTSRAPPPPVAPKPKLIPEKLNFSSKIKKFEEEIHAQKNVNGGASSATSTAAARAANPPPMKKPLVSSQDLEKLKQEEVSRRDRLASDQQPSTAPQPCNEHEDEELDSVLELSNDACFNLLLKNGACLAPNGPAVVRTRNAEIRAEKAAARALANGHPGPLDVYPSPNCSLPDEASFSRASSSLSSVEQRAMDLEKRQAWRQARLQSMDVESKRTDEVIKLITSIPSSPIPIQ